MHVIFQKYDQTCRLNSVSREIVSYVTIVFYDNKVRERNKAQMWLLLVCCGFFIWKRYNRTYFHRTILWLTCVGIITTCYHNHVIIHFPGIEIKKCRCLEDTMRFWNNIHLVHSKIKDWKDVYRLKCNLWLYYKLDIYVFSLSLSRCLCWLSISPPRVPPNNSPCLDTDMAY
jgi:hypothetical protein